MPSGTSVRGEGAAGSLAELPVVARLPDTKVVDPLSGLLLLLAAAAALFGWWVFDTLNDLAPGNDPSPVASWIGAASLVLAVLTGTLGLVLVLSRSTRERLRRERQFERLDDG